MSPLERITLCDSKLRAQTRDVYGRHVAPGQWRVRVSHDPDANINLEIKRLDVAKNTWTAVPVRQVSGDLNLTNREFELQHHHELKLIFSSGAPSGEISYRCDLEKF